MITRRAAGVAAAGLTGAALLLLTGCAAATSGRASGPGPVTSPHTPALAVAPAAGVSEGWIDSCLASEGLRASVAPASATAVPAAQAVAATTRWHPGMADHPATTQFVDVQPSQAGPQPPAVAAGVLGQVITDGPVWLVGISGYRFADPGGLMLHVATPRMLTHYLAFLAPDGTPEMGMGCP